MASAATKPSWMGDYSIGQVSNAVAGKNTANSPSKLPKTSDKTVPKSSLAAMFDKRPQKDRKKKRDRSGAAARLKKKKPKQEKLGDGTRQESDRVKHEKKNAKNNGEPRGATSLSQNRTSGSNHIFFEDGENEGPFTRTKPTTQPAPKTNNEKSKLIKKRSAPHSGTMSQKTFKAGQSKKHIHFGDDDSQDLFPTSSKRVKKNKNTKTDNVSDTMNIKPELEKDRVIVTGKKNKKKMKKIKGDAKIDSNGAISQAQPTTADLNKESAACKSENPLETTSQQEAPQGKSKTVLTERQAAKKLKKKLIWKEKKKAKKEGRDYKASNVKVESSENTKDNTRKRKLQTEDDVGIVVQNSLPGQLKTKKAKTGPQQDVNKDADTPGKRKRRSKKKATSMKNKSVAGSPLKQPKGNAPHTPSTGVTTAATPLSERKQKSALKRNSEYFKKQKDQKNIEREEAISTGNKLHKQAVDHKSRTAVIGEENVGKEKEKEEDERDDDDSEEDEDVNDDSEEEEEEEEEEVIDVSSDDDQGEDSDDGAVIIDEAEEGTDSEDEESIDGNEDESEEQSIDSDDGDFILDEAEEGTDSEEEEESVDEEDEEDESEEESIDSDDSDSDELPKRRLLDILKDKQRKSLRKGKDDESDEDNESSDEEEEMEEEEEETGSDSEDDGDDSEGDGDDTDDERDDSDDENDQDDLTQKEDEIEDVLNQYESEIVDLDSNPISIRSDGEANNNIDDDGKEGETVKKNKTIHDPEVMKRTIFVGNLPIDATKQDLKELFKKYGAIESMRFRSGARADPKITQKVAMITKQLHPERSSYNAYVVFASPESAQRALRRNGKVHKNHHIRVDLVYNSNKHNTKHSVFIGNLPFDIENEPVVNHFMQCGEVEGVRLIRDKATGLGKGIGYVLLKDSSSVELAMKLDGSSLAGRSIRVERAVKKETLQRQQIQKSIRQKRGGRNRGIKGNKDTKVKGDKDKSPQKRKRLDPKVLQKKQKRMRYKKKLRAKGVSGKLATNAQKKKKVTTKSKGKKMKKNK